MDWNDHSVICTYRVRKESREPFVQLLRQHWPALKEAGLVSDIPAVHFEAVGSGDPHDESGLTFVEIYSWAGPDSADLAHRMPEVMAVWEPMGALVESRAGRPAMEFARVRPLDLDGP